MADFDIILSRFYKFLVNSVPRCVIKMSTVAKSYETVESKKAGDKYVSIRMGTDSFVTYHSFSKAVLEKAGFNADEIAVYSQDKSLIPKERRDAVIELAGREFLENYVEQNDYYRMLNGLPGLDDEEIWLPDFELYDKYEIEPCPVDQIKPDILATMEKLGELDEVKELYPEAKFLNYVGERKIDILIARKEENFSMLYFPNDNNSFSFYRDFLLTYNECREYFLTVVYNNYYTSKYAEYDGFIGFMILTMTINRMISNNIKAFVERDFYDELTVRTFLSAYGLVCDKIFTLTQLKLIAKNLNILLRNKSTDVVLLDILNLLDYSNFHIYKYYLLKSHRLDNDGKPIFQYKTVVDKDGNETRELDKANMYNYKFVRVDIEEDDIQDAINDASNYMSFSEVTSDDPYWIDDLEARNLMMNTTFNYLDTKYMDMSIIYRMHEIMLEISYFSRMVLDKGVDTKRIMIMMSNISSYQEISLFDTLIFLICVLCKYFDIKPTLMKTASKVLHIVGYNFKADFDTIRKDIENNPHMKDTDLLKYVKNVAFTSASDVNDMFLNIKHLDYYLVDLMNETSDYEAYTAYRKLYDTLSTIELDNSIYALSDGTIPDTFDEYLKESNSILYETYDKLETQEECSEMIGYVTARLTKIFTNTKYLKYIQLSDTSLLDGILKLLNYFKSLTVHFRGANVIILFDSRFDNGVHLYHKLKESTNFKFHETTPGSRSWEAINHVDLSISQIDETAIDSELQRAVEDLYMPHDIKFKEYFSVSSNNDYKINDNVINLSTHVENTERLSNFNSRGKTKDGLIIDDVSMYQKEEISAKDTIQLIWSE